MVVIKVVKNNNPIFNVLTMGVGNANVYNVIVDKDVLATLQPGEETTIELPPGVHTVVFKVARAMGVKSNKLTVNIEPNKDYSIQMQNGMSGLVASYSFLKMSNSDVINCPHCGAPNKIIGNISANCEYCGSPL
ncbi:MAG: zinc ribbon domain-containing protein [Prevotellaceae bacterium]|jgi:DNA-directed RNA polymerase subunit RPC12/RpoP|nr:zinc ribbon domain-containing protein [Prevotellaceae bacterium]